MIIKVTFILYFKYSSIWYNLTFNEFFQTTMQLPQTVTYSNQNPMFGGQQGQPMAQQQTVNQQQWGYGQQPGQQIIPQQNLPGTQQQNYYPQQMPQQGNLSL